MTALQTAAERNAAAAEQLEAFSGLNLLHIRRQAELLLGLIGRQGMFDQFTVHDITHVDAMLFMLDWLVPDRTRKIMTPADWLLVVLAIYFHDLGLLVTENEYSRRDISGFPAFCERELFNDVEGQDYKARVWERFPDESQRQRFLYQEFVRATHAHRIANWILGRASDHLGSSDVALDEVNGLLGVLPPKFRSDLALVCESHHLDNLGDTNKYRISLPYGNSVAETANVQYAALLLRTADLLHITRDRTPSILFRTISPSDPVSQEEWAKQNAVRNVRPRLGRGPDGIPSETADRDTVEIFATFTRVDGFFALTSYLHYAGNQLRKSSEWAEASRKRLASRYEFPWRSIDDSNIEAQGFLPQPFAFELDQARILDLLTGHTLYNDSAVVLRELIQNALDAVRLQTLIDAESKGAATQGRVYVQWNSAEGILSVQDNGTGMTQAIIERHLLRVGSSRYQDPEFMKQYPSFSAISRFGIGVLSCFMVADDVEIVTVHPDEEEARHLSLRTVHGRYLIRLLDKATDSQVADIGKHGSLVRLRLRPSARLSDVVATARKWVLFPGTEVVVHVLGSEHVRVGFGCPQEALESAMRALGFDLIEEVSESKEKATRVKVVEREIAGTTVAFAIEWSDYFEDWAFVDIGGRLRSLMEDREELNLPLGFCVEGMRVEFDSAGFRGFPIAAISNATGVSAPKTNVARSSIETTAEYEASLRSIYRAIVDHIADEVTRLETEHQFSLTWAVEEARYLLRPLLRRETVTGGGGQPVRPDLLAKEIDRLPLLLVERDGKREAVAPCQFASELAFWTIDSALLRSAEVLIKEAVGRTSLASIIEALGTPSLRLPPGPVLANSYLGRLLNTSIFREREIDQIVVHREHRRVDFHWVSYDGASRWIEPQLDVLREVRGRRTVQGSLLVNAFQLTALKTGTSRVAIIGAGDEIGVRVRGVMFLFPGTLLAEHVGDLLGRLKLPIDKRRRSAIVCELMLIMSRLEDPGLTWKEEKLRPYVRRTNPELEELIEYSRLAQVGQSIRAPLFDPSAWVRKKEKGQGYPEDD